MRYCKLKLTFNRGREIFREVCESSLIIKNISCCDQYLPNSCLKKELWIGLGPENKSTRTRIHLREIGKSSCQEKLEN